MDILLMGDSNAGRSSIAKTIFQKISGKSTMLLGPTNKMETYEFKIQNLDFRMCDFPTKYDLEEPAPSDQMILKNAVALVYILNPQAEDTYSSIENFGSIFEYLKKKNTNNCQFFIFINKVDVELNSQESKDEFLIKHKKKMADEGIDAKQVSIYFTSINDYSIYDAVSKVLQKIIPCSPYLCKLLNKLAEFCKIQKIFIFDICSKLYIAHNDNTNIEPLKYEIFCELIDIHIDISLLYGGTDKKEENRETSGRLETCVKLNVDSDEKRECFVLNEIEFCLCISYLIKESNYDRPYLIDANIQKFKNGLVRLLADSTKFS